MNEHAEQMEGENIQTGKVIVADTGPLIALACVGSLYVLPVLFSKVMVPQGVLAEALLDISLPGAAAIKCAVERGWLSPCEVTLTDLFETLVVLLDQGEAEVLAVAKATHAIALIDEQRGRRIAASQGISVTGSAAIILLAKRKALIPAVKPVLMQLKDHGYRLSDVLIDEVLRRAGER